MWCNEVGLNVQRYTGPFMNCTDFATEGGLTNDTMNAWNAQCLSRLCGASTDGYQLNQTAKCILYSEFADICNAILPEGNKLYQQTGLPGPDFWRRRYNCTNFAPTTTVAPGSFLAGDPFGVWKRAAGFMGFGGPEDEESNGVDGENLACLHFAVWLGLLTFFLQ